ncbi:hypothetical protein ANO11243_095140 [Dothideomycetidae sp. 11243]|nr:hypothetical protein ANO11243_095140 [fungal sp. No.11243]
MSTQRVNVLVYTGTGATIESVKHCLWSLRRLLSPNYAVIPISSDAVLKEPWTASCALFVMPGGADLGYCRVLNGDGNHRISEYVNRGGAYLGLCAGGYYGSSRCEFEEGNPKMEVVGDRELAFYPGICRGLAYPGFVYHSEMGAKASEIKVNKDALISAGGAIPDVFRTYYNGGGVFVDASTFSNRGVEVLADFTDQVNVDPGEGQAAVVYCKVGDGHAILTSPHPEFAAVNLSKGDENPDYPAIKAALAADDKPRVDFMKACLAKFGLKANQDSSSVPSLSRLHLSAMQPADLADAIKALKDTAATENGQQLIEGENDTFLLEQDGAWSLGNIKAALPTPGPEAVPKAEDPLPEEEDKMVDYDAVIKRLVLHPSTQPESKVTPYFNHAAFFANLDHYNAATKNHEGTFGRTLLYGEVVTSTNTLLEKNPSLLSNFPTGLTATATTQLAGRGRGSNVWVSPPGSLMFSTVLRHALDLNTSAPVVFVQYILALAIINGIKTYDKGYSTLPVRLKWPNDIYALDPSKLDPGAKPLKPSTDPLNDSQRAQYTKIGGILISTSYTPSTPFYTLVCGAGLNLSNAAPTTSLNQLATHFSLPPFQGEKLLASILANFEVLYTRFCKTGFGTAIRPGYEAVWLHNSQIVQLESDADVQQRFVAGAARYDGPTRCRVKGVSGDWGLLVVEELVGEEGRERPTGKIYELQSDSNSFDFFRGLLKRKV